MEHVLLTWNAWPKNYIKVCLESLRRYNKTCKIYFLYRNSLVKFLYRKHNIQFIKLTKQESFNLTFSTVCHAKKLCIDLNHGDKILILDPDILFQNDPFLMFKEFPGQDLYYTHCLMSKEDSLRPKKLWSSVKNKVNGGVWGLRVTDASKEFMNFWVDNLLEDTWQPWIDSELRIQHAINGKTDIRWFCDQDFLNCVDQQNLIPISNKLKKVDVGYKYNYFTSTWGYFNQELNMGNKIGDSSYVAIHFKASFKDTFNLNNRFIYNMKNILNKKDLTTPKSRDNIYRKFLSRGEARFNVV